MFSALLQFHSIFRYVVLVLLVLAVIKSFYGWLGKKEFTAADNKLGLFLVMSVHIQFLFGIVLYFISPTVNAGLRNMSEAMKDAVLRFWTVEHIAIMILSVIVITMGRIVSKKAAGGPVKFKRAALFYLAGLMLLMYGIPWLSRPFF